MTMGGDSFAVGLGPLREHVLTTGVVRHACRHRVTARGVFGLGGFFHTLGAWERHRFNGGAVAVCFECCCGGMCWPRERPATHAAAGAAARGSWVFAAARGGGKFRNDGGLGGILSHAREWSDTHAASGETARGV